MQKSAIASPIRLLGVAKKDERFARLFRGAAGRICKERSDGLAIVRTLKLLFF